MSFDPQCARRDFLRQAAALAAAASLAGGYRSTSAAEPAEKPIRKSLKFGMVEGSEPVLDKFKMLKAIGFDGVELESPTKLDLDEVLAARDATGLVINGTVDAVHWKQPFSSPDEAVREQAVAALKTALRQTKQLGGTSVLVVPALVNREVPYDVAYTRSQAEIRKALPVAEETGVKIAFENVWNNFLVSPLEAARYIDEFQSPLVVAHFDVGNVLRYGFPEQWIRILGPRIFKLDVKEYSLKKAEDVGMRKGFEVPLMEGDCDWPAVMQALQEIGYRGWAAAEVPGGDRARLADISQRMDRIFVS